MYEVGSICIKLAGRDAGREAVVVDILDDNYVLIDGNVRRRKCNVFHLEPTSKKIDIKKNAKHEEVKAAFDKIGLGVWETKPRKTAERPKKQRKKKEKVVEEKKEKKPEAKKEVATEKKETKVESKPAEKEAKEKPKTVAKKKAVKKVTKE